MSVDREAGEDGDGGAAEGVGLANRRNKAGDEQNLQRHKEHTQPADSKTAEKNNNKQHPINQQNIQTKWKNKKHNRPQMHGQPHRYLLAPKLVQRIKRYAFGQ